MKSEIEELEAEVLNGIQPFSGLPVRGGGGNVADQVILSGGAMQQVKTSYTTAVAVQQPRSIAKITNNILEESRLAGKSFYYRWTTKNKDGSKGLVQGASIDLAMAMFRYFGNCAYELDFSETASHYIFKATFIDLESGTSSPRLFKQRKGQGIGMKDKDRAEDIVFQIGQSKAIRNAVVKAMPEWLIERAIEVATEAELNKAKKENIHLARQKVIEFFGQYGVSPDRIEAERKRPADQWTPQDIVDLRGMASALKEGRVGADELFPLPGQTEQEKDSPPKQAPEKSEAPANTSPKENNPAGLGTQPEPSPMPEKETFAEKPTRKKREAAASESHGSKKPEQDPVPLTPEEKAIMDRLIAAREDFPDEFRQAFQERGLKPGQEITPEDAKWILSRINLILDEQM